MTEKTHKQLSEEFYKESKKIDDLQIAVAEASKKLKEHIQYLDELNRLSIEAQRKENGASALEVTFKSSVDEHLPIINTHIDTAKEELKKAKDIAEKHGLMFKSPVVDLSDYGDSLKAKNDIYMSKSFNEKYNDLVSRTKLYSYLKVKFGVDIYSGFGNRFSDNWLGCWLPSSMGAC